MKRILSFFCIYIYIYIVSYWIGSLWEGLIKGESLIWGPKLVKYGNLWNNLPQEIQQNVYSWTRFSTQNSVMDCITRQTVYRAPIIPLWPLEGGGNLGYPWLRGVLFRGNILFFRCTKFMCFRCVLHVLRYNHDLLRYNRLFEYGVV